jgi:hypothetical protein
MSRVSPMSIVPQNNSTIRTINVTPFKKNPTLRDNNSSLNLIKQLRNEELVNKNNNSFISKWNESKPKKFIDSNSYIQYDTVYSKILMLLTIIKISLAIAFIIFYTRNCGSQAVYVPKSMITDEFKESTKKYNEMNRFQSIDSMFSIALGGTTVLFTIIQFIHMYNRNTFKTKDIDFTQI